MAFLSCRGVDIRGALSKTGKSRDRLSPVFEAISNSLDSFHDRKNEGDFQARITVEFHFKKSLVQECVGAFDRIVVSDNGAGIDKRNFERLTRLFDGSKGKLNKGSGRIQFVKFFDRTEILSVFEENGRFFSRECVLSSSDFFLDQNAILSYVDPIPIEERSEVGTNVVFLTPSISDAQFYERLLLADVRNALLSRYLLRYHYDELDLQFTLSRFCGGKKTDEIVVDGGDFPTPQTKNFRVAYKSLKRTDNGKSFVERKDIGPEDFTLSIFRLPKERQGINESFFTSRGERVEDAKLRFAAPRDAFGNDRFIATINGEYVDARVSETRERFLAPSDADLLKDSDPSSNLYDSERVWITLDDIRKEAIKACAQLLPEIDKKRRERAAEIKRLGATFGFPPSVVRDVAEKTTLGDSPQKILARMYRLEADVAANVDVELDEANRDVESLDPTSPNYQSELIKRAGVVLRSTPERNRLALSHYVARRRLVLDVFEKTLRQGTNVRESILHNILFSQHSTAPVGSDLWLLEEEFLYYSGASEIPLKDVEYSKGKKLLRDISDCTEEDRVYLTSDGKDRTGKRPDILVFPNEGKCVIIELKRPGVDLQDHIHQLDTYASLIHEFASPDCEITRFFTYLIGDRFNPRDLMRADRDLVESKQFGFMYAFHRVPAENKAPASERREIHTYDSLLERAKARNRIFFNLLLEDDSMKE